MPPKTHAAWVADIRAQVEAQRPKGWEPGSWFDVQATWLAELDRVRSDLEKVSAERDEQRERYEVLSTDFAEASVRWKTFANERDAALARAEKAEWQVGDERRVSEANCQAYRGALDAAQAQVHELLCAVQAVLPEMEQSSDKEIRQLVPGLACLLPEPKP